MKITRRPIATSGTTDLRDRAWYAALWCRWAPRFRFELRDRALIRERAHEGRRCLALLAAADRIDARLGIVSDGLHYAGGQLFNVNEGRPEPIS